MYHLRIIREDVNHCTVLTHGYLHIIPPLYLCFRVIDDIRDKFLAIYFFGAPAHPYPIDGGNIDIGGMILNETWSVHVCQMCVSLELSFGMIYDKSYTRSLIILIGGLCSTNMVFIINLVIVLEDQLDL